MRGGLHDPARDVRRRPFCESTRRDRRGPLISMSTTICSAVIAGMPVSTVPLVAS
jgi:hypothetical protein